MLPSSHHDVTPVPASDSMSLHTSTLPFHHHVPVQDQSMGGRQGLHSFTLASSEATDYLYLLEKEASVSHILRENPGGWVQAVLPVEFLATAWALAWVLPG